MKLRVISTSLAFSGVCMLSSAKSLRGNWNHHHQRHAAPKRKYPRKRHRVNKQYSNNIFLEPGHSDKKDARIIGGSEATPNEHPFAVSLEDDMGHFCGGSLITKNIILTAAHCQGAPFDVAVGKHNINSKNGGQVVGIEKQIPHPNYDEFTTDNDFMVVVLSSAVNLSDNVKLVKLNSDSSEPRMGDEVTVMGWGDTDISESSSKLSDVLMEVQVNVVSNKDCESSSDGRDSYEGQITDNMLCAEHRQAKDSCQGDSGGPLVEEAGGVAKQVGVVSWGIGCASDYFPGVYARVSKAYNWIESEVCKENEGYATEAGFDCKNADYVPSPPAPSPSGGGGNPAPSPSGNFQPSGPSGGSNWNDDFGYDDWSSGNDDYSFDDGFEDSFDDDYSWGDDNYYDDWQPSGGGRYDDFGYDDFGDDDFGYDDIYY